MDLLFLGGTKMFKILIKSQCAPMKSQKLKVYRHLKVGIFIKLGLFSYLWT